MKTCPCGSGADLDACCNRYISGKEQAPTAEALMRARYTSYTLGKIDFIEKTQTDEARKEFDRAASEKWSKDSEWRGLRVLALERGGQNDTKGVVSFVAAFAQEGKEYHHEEIAQFRKENGAWLFVDGKTPNRETFVKTGPDVGRNDPCHCGSGKKFKKCHGK